MAGDVIVRGLGPDGAFDAALGGADGRKLVFSFGGGAASVYGRSTRPLPPLAQGSFMLGQMLRRPDGTFLAAGGVKVLRYTGEGAGFSTGLFAAASLTPYFGPDTGFGGPATAPRVRVLLAHQTVRGARRLQRFVVRLRSSAEGLALVKIHARGRVIAQIVEPVYRAGTSSVKVSLTRAGEKLVRRRAALRVRASVRLRDLFAQHATARASRTIRF
jgi:hypothetical protein